MATFAEIAEQRLARDQESNEDNSFVKLAENQLNNIQTTEQRGFKLTDVSPTNIFSSTAASTPTTVSEEDIVTKPTEFATDLITGEAQERGARKFADVLGVGVKDRVKRLVETENISVEEAQKKAEASFQKDMELAEIALGSIGGTGALGPKAGRLVQKAVQKGVSSKGIQKAAEVGEKLLAPTQASLDKFVSKFPVKVKDVFKAEIPKQTEEIFTQRRGILNDADISELAKGKVGILDKIAEAKPGTILPAEEALQMRREIADRILKAVSPEEIAKEVEVLPQVLGVRAETGRALRTFKEPIGGASEAAQRLFKLADETSDPLLKENLKSLGRVLTGAERDPTLMDKLVEWATAIKLTSPLTQFRNITGNTFSTLIKIPERFTSVGVDKIRRVITGRSQERFARDAVADTVGTFEGLKDGARNAVKALRDENFRVGGTIEEVATPGGAIGGKLGKVVRAPFRLLNAVDAFFQTANQRGALKMAATRSALKEGLSGEKLVQKINDLVQNPDERLLKEAIEEGKRIVFRQDLEGFMQFADNIRQKFPALKLILPFFRTPANILKAFIQRTPLTLTLPSTLRALKTGGGEASDVLSRMIVGSSVLSALTYYALEGRITGRGPKNKAERDALFRQGWQPFSIRIGDTYISYRGFEPLTAYLGLAADIAESSKEPSESVVLSALGAISADFVQQPFLTGVSDLFDLMNDPEANTSKFVSTFVSGATIPSGISYAARLLDPIYRQPKGILQTLESRIPGLSQRVLPVRGVFGEEAQREGTALERLVPFTTTTFKRDPVEQELDALNKTIGFPSKQAFGEKLNDEEYDTLLRVTGKITKEVLHETIQSSEYKSSSPVEKEKIIDSAVREVRERVREVAFQEKALLSELKDKLRNLGYDEDRIEMIAPELLIKVMENQ